MSISCNVSESCICTSYLLAKTQKMKKTKQVIFYSFAIVMLVSLAVMFYFDTLSLRTGTFRMPNTFAGFYGTHVNSTNLQNVSRSNNNTGIRIAKMQDGLHSSKSREVKTILFYTGFFGQLPWPHVVGREKNLTDFKGRPCKVAACNFSISKDDLSRPSTRVVIFHGYSTPPPAVLKNLASKKPKGQMWAWFHEESQSNTNYPLDQVRNIFELTITHRHESDIHTMYGEYFPLDDKSKLQAQKLYWNKNFAKGKDKLILWFASNCVSLRLEIAKAIAKHIRVDVFGGCQKHFHNKPAASCSRRTRECQKLNDQYKFFLSFENTNCKGYLTEKYWENALDRNVVPVVIAGSYNKDVLIPGSYIDILDFPNAKALANYLNYLDKNETAYNSYFEWKTKYGYTRETNWVCDLCEYLHVNKTKTSFWDMKTFYGAEENCHADDDRLRTSWIEAN